MKELFNLISSILLCWANGFSTKTGAELFLLEAARRENRKYPRGSQRNPKMEALEMQRKYALRLNKRKS